MQAAQQSRSEREMDALCGVRGCYTARKQLRKADRSQAASKSAASGRRAAHFGRPRIHREQFRWPAYSLNGGCLSLLYWLPRYKHPGS